MAFARLSTRSIIIVSNDSDNYDACENLSLFQCPQRIMLGDVAFVVLLFAFVILIWKTGLQRCYKQRRDKTTDESNSKEDNNNNRLSLPYPQPPSEMYEATKGVEPNNSTSTLVDPYLVTNSFDNSLISKDDSFKRMAMPEPVLKRRESVNHSALELPERRPMVVPQLPELKLDSISTTIQLHDDDDDDDDDDKKTITDQRPASPPPPAYVRKSHSKT